MMTSSPYFTTRARQTRSVARASISVLSSQRKPTRKHIKIEDVKEEAVTSADRGIEDEVVKKRMKKERSGAPTQIAEWEPSDWRKQLANIREMRKDREAPVDSQGCEKTADTGESPEVNFCTPLPYSLKYLRVSSENVYTNCD